MLFLPPLSKASAFGLGLQSQAAGLAGSRPPERSLNPRRLRGTIPQFHNWAVPGHWPGREDWERHLIVTAIPNTPRRLQSTTGGHVLP